MRLFDPQVSPFSEPVSSAAWSVIALWPAIASDRVAAGQSRGTRPEVFAPACHLASRAARFAFAGRSPQSAARHAAARSRLAVARRRPALSAALFHLVLRGQPHQRPLSTAVPSRSYRSLILSTASRQAARAKSRADLRASPAAAPTTCSPSIPRARPTKCRPPSARASAVPRRCRSPARRPSQSGLGRSSTANASSGNFRT